MWSVVIRGFQRLQVLRNLSQRQGLRDPKDFQVLKSGCSNLLMLRELFQSILQDLPQPACSNSTSATGGPHITWLWEGVASALSGALTRAAATPTSGLPCKVLTYNTQLKTTPAMQAGSPALLCFAALRLAVAHCLEGACFVLLQKTQRLQQACPPWRSSCLAASAMRS